MIPLLGAHYRFSCSINNPLTISIFCLKFRFAGMDVNAIVYCFRFFLAITFPDNSMISINSKWHNYVFYGKTVT